MSFNHHSIDESGHVDFNPYYYTDNYNNYTFSVSRKGETTFIRPTFHDPNLIELKVGVLLPFHQNNNNWTRIMTMRQVLSHFFFCYILTNLHLFLVVLQRSD